MIDSLYQLALGGDKRSEEELFRYLTDRFRLFVRRRVSNDKDAEDIVQNTMIAISGKYKTIDFQTSFASWAYKVLEYKTLDHFRSQQRRELHIKDTPEKALAGTPLNLDQLTKQQMLECLRKVGQVNRRFARILNMHYQGYTSDEICEKLEIKKNNFYVVLSRARAMLEICFKKGDVADNE